MAREDVAEEAMRRNVIGMADDGAFILERFITSDHTAVFFCRVDRDDKKHELLLEVYKPKQLFSNQRPTLEADAFRGAYPSQVRIVSRKLGPPPAGSSSGGGAGRPGATTHVWSKEPFEAMPRRLEDRIKRDGKAEFPVVLDGREAEMLADALVGDAQKR